MRGTRLTFEWLLLAKWLNWYDYYFIIDYYGHKIILWFKVHGYVEIQLKHLKVISCISIIVIIQETWYIIWAIDCQNEKVEIDNPSTKL